MPYRNPYAGVDWSSVHHLHSVCHTHTTHSRGTAQEIFESIYAQGIRHFALANYRPSEPAYPLSDWFENVPSDALGCPNAEHHGCTDVGFHFVAIGSTYNCGHGVKNTAAWAFEQAVDGLIYAGGGGIVINHPWRNGHDLPELEYLLDLDARVLGIEIYNHRSVERSRYQHRGWARDLWQELLVRGRHVLGFCNPDYHSPWDDGTWGRNVLLVPQPTEEAAARAYGQGAFYGALAGTGLAFRRIDAAGDRVVVQLNGPGRIEFWSDAGLMTAAAGPEALYERSGRETFVRIEARGSGTGQHIFAQPIFFAAPRVQKR